MKAVTRAALICHRDLQPKLLSIRFIIIGTVVRIGSLKRIVLTKFLGQHGIKFSPIIDTTLIGLKAMVDKMGFVEDFSQKQVTGIGVLEIMGAMGMILPWATGILPWLTPLAAVGLALTMVGAFLTHLRRKELIPMGVVNIVLFSLALFKK